MTFAAPWLLLALVALPLLWWLLRVVPPAPRLLEFPAVRLLLGLDATQQTAQRTPPWVLALRVAAAALVILGLAGPTLQGGGRLPGRGPLLLVVDDGWAAAADWGVRTRAAEDVLRRAEREGRTVALLATAPPGDGTAMAASAAMPPAELRARLAVLRPKPYPADRAAATAALRVWADAGHTQGGAVLLADGLTDGGGWPGFAAALRASGPVLVLAAADPPGQVLLAPTAEAEALRLHVAQAPRPTPTRIDVLARSGDGRTVARVQVAVAAGEGQGAALLALPTELRNQVERLSLAPAGGGVAGAGGTFLLDEGYRRRPVGLLAGDQAADTPLSGAAYYVRRALAPYAAIREAELDTLLGRPLSVLVLADHALSAADPDSERLRRWVEQGGLLLRFAGPATAQEAGAAGTVAAADADPLLPVPLLGYERELGGALSWTEPARLAPFAEGSPFRGLAIPDDVRIARQVLADPAGDVASATWASLADGTPLVTQRRLGQGRVVLFHVTANADWSNLPLSGLFVDMLRRIVALSAGVGSTAGEAGGQPLAPAATLDGSGELGQPPATALPIAAGAFAAAAASVAHPPGLYGPEADRRALNLAAHLDAPERAPAIAGAGVEDVAAAAPGIDLGAWLLALAACLLAADLLASLALRGLWRRAIAAALVGVALCGGAPGAGAVEPAEPNPALAVRLAYVVSGDPALDGLARAGLAGLSAYVNARTAAVLAEPAAVTPGQDDLSFYPLLYWPVAIDAAAPDAATVAALNTFMAHGGIMLIDTRDAQDAASGGGAAAGRAAGRDVLAGLLRGGGSGLVVPPLAPLTGQHVLARAFYLLSDFPGRYAGEHGLGGARRGPQQRQREPAGGGRPRLGRGVGGGCQRAASVCHPARRRTPAHPGLSFRCQPRDVHADRQLQGRPGTRAGAAGTAGAVARDAAAGDLGDPPRAHRAAVAAGGAGIAVRRRGGLRAVAAGKRRAVARARLRGAARLAVRAARGPRDAAAAARHRGGGGGPDRLDGRGRPGGAGACGTGRAGGGRAARPGASSCAPWWWRTVPPAARSCSRRWSGRSPRSRPTGSPAWSR